MSAFFGDLSRTDQPIEPEILSRMAAAIPWYGPDGRGQWSSAEVGLGHLLHSVTPESRHERQPLVQGSGRVVLAASARLDNREKLIEHLRLAPTADAPLTDPELILAAYTAWGEACPARLLGDFAFALWDAAAHKLLCVRDPIGVAPFYYHLSARRFVFANDIRAVLAHPAVPGTLNDTAIAMHLRHPQYAMPEMTFLAGVKKLRPGRVLVVTPDTVTERVYWTPESAATVHLSGAAAYAEALRDLLEQAVTDRLRSLHPIGAHISGGLDSSAVAAVAVRSLHAQSKTLTGYSWLPTLSAADDPNAPEYAATRRVIDALGIAVENVDLTVASLCAELRRDLSLDGYADLWYEPLVRARARQRGIGVILSGWGGDEVVSSGARGYPAELFWRRAWGRLARWIVGRSRRAPNPWRRGAGLLYHQVLWPSLPERAARLRPNARRETQQELCCIAPAFDTAAPPTDSGLEWRRTRGVHAVQAQRLTMGHLQARMEVWATQGAQDGIEYRYPLLDRRVVEFCLGAPPELFADGEYSRPLFRSAVRGLLPDPIRLDNVKLERLRVERYIDLLGAASIQVLTDLLDEARQTGQPAAARYLDLGCVQARAGEPPALRVGQTIGWERQVQVWIMAEQRRRASMPAA
jgi:asparagine synthase (glutamine-hydrolysing)